MNSLDVNPLVVPAVPRQPSISQSVYRAIFELILTGELTPGSVVSEKQLALRLEVSRTPVHNAVLQLAKDGLVFQESNRRPVIRQVEQADVEEIFDMRRLLECEAARRAASRIDRAMLSNLRRAADQVNGVLEPSTALTRWADFDDMFHEAIAASCGSERLSEDIRRYRMVHHALNRLRMTADLIPQAMAEHMSILNALDERDPVRAGSAMELHLAEWKAFYVQRFKTQRPKSSLA